MELVIVGYGAAGYCGMCPEQLQNATWVAWFKSNVDFARGLGVGVSAYTLMQHNGWGESVPPAEQAMNRDGSRAGVAFFATDWHAGRLLGQPEIRHSMPAYIDSPVPPPSLQPTASLCSTLSLRSDSRASRLTGSKRITPAPMREGIITTMVSRARGTRRWP